MPLARNENFLNAKNFFEKKVEKQSSGSDQAHQYKTRPTTNKTPLIIKKVSQSLEHKTPPLEKRNSKAFDQVHDVINKKNFESKLALPHLEEKDGRIYFNKELYKDRSAPSILRFWKGNITTALKKIKAIEEEEKIKTDFLEKGQKLIKDINNKLSSEDKKADQEKKAFIQQKLEDFKAYFSEMEASKDNLEREKGLKYFMGTHGKDEFLNATLALKTYLKKPESIKLISEAQTQHKSKVDGSFTVPLGNKWLCWIDAEDLLSASSDISPRFSLIEEKEEIRKLSETFSKLCKIFTYKIEEKNSSLKTGEVLDPEEKKFTPAFLETLRKYSEMIEQGHAFTQEQEKEFFIVTAILDSYLETPISDYLCKIIPHESLEDFFTLLNKIKPEDLDFLLPQKRVERRESSRSLGSLSLDSGIQSQSSSRSSSPLPSYDEPPLAQNPVYRPSSLPLSLPPRPLKPNKALLNNNLLPQEAMLTPTHKTPPPTPDKSKKPLLISKPQPRKLSSRSSSPLPSYDEPPLVQNPVYRPPQEAMLTPTHKTPPPTPNKSKKPLLISKPQPRMMRPKMPPPPIKQGSSR